MRSHSYRALLGAGAVLLSCPNLSWTGGSLVFRYSDFPESAFQDVELDYTNQLTLPSRWTQSTNSLPARTYAGLAFDSLRAEALLFGGLDSTGNSLRDTWNWKSQTFTWTEKTPSVSPPARYGHALVWMGCPFLLFGGVDNETEVDLYSVKCGDRHRRRGGSLWRR